MPEFVEDPSLLTKERLKSELLAHSVELPSSSATKDVYVQLYLQNLTVRNRGDAALDAFSSDEEPPVAPRGASSRTRSSPRKSTKRAEKVEPLDIAALSNERLREELLKHGVDAGPILASTRKPHEKKLQKLLENGAPPPPADSQVNGDSEPGVYSDEEEELPAEPEPEPDPEPEPAPVVERQLRSRTRRSQQQQTVQKPKTSHSPKKEQGFLNDLNSPTEMLATCRQPIRGAGGCTVTSSALLTNDASLQPARDSKTNSSSSSEQRATATVSSQSPSSTKPSTVTPPAGQVRAVRRSMSVWIKLCLLGVVVGFLFLVYQSMETKLFGPFLD